MTVSRQDLSGNDARQQLYEIMRCDADFTTRAARSLELGQAYLGVDNGHLTRIDPAAGYWKAIESTDSPDGEFPPGLTLDLDTTYCRRTIQQESSIALHDAPSQGWADDPAFETHGLHCYHGVPVLALDEIYGTVCFVSETPREEPFTQEESRFAELLGHLLGQAIERDQHDAELSEREEMIDVLCRVLRHNLRNDLTTIQGCTELVHDRLPDDAETQAEIITDTINELLELTDRTRQLSTLVTESFDRRELDVESLVRHTTAEVEEVYSEVTISVEGASSAQIQASPQLERALRELLENAAKHAGEAPVVTVSISNTDETIQIRVGDNGPGLPKQERDVLQKGAETPLEHGSGLGLWVVYWIVTRHDGSIETEVSEAGTSVTMTLPYGPTNISSRGDPSPDEQA